MYWALAVLKFHPHRTAGVCQDSGQVRMKANRSKVSARKVERRQELFLRFRCARRSSSPRRQEMFRLLREIEKKRCPGLAARCSRVTVRHLSAFSEPADLQRRWKRRLSLRRALLQFGNFEKDPDRSDFPPVGTEFLRNWDTGKRWTMSIWNRR